ncbi:hypothetical protein [Paenibacillus xanthanilyticus]|uniref:Uncharacterized protein n=1 Tax=Paenibacillus xanthanilyticus TaxID=1783531 RepID=A0ABV8K331_9BACL
MEKLLIIEPLSPIGHRDINQVTIELLKNDYCITYVSKEDYLDEAVLRDINFCGIPAALFEPSGKIKTRLNNLRILDYIAEKVNLEDYNKVLFMSYETVTFSLYARLHFRKLNHIFVLNHMNIDEVVFNRVKRMFFKLIPMQIVHLNYASFITDYVKAEFKKKSGTIRHTLNTYKLKDISCENDRLLDFLNDEYKLIVAPSNNRLDKKLVEKLIELDQSGELEKSKVRLFLKSKDTKYQGNNLQIVNLYLKDSEFNFLVDRANYVFLPYIETEYFYRVSGVFYDCITFNKPIICSQMEFFKSMFDSSGKIGYMYRSIKDLDLFLREGINSTPYSSFLHNMNALKKEYSDENIKSDLMLLFDRM